MSANFNWPTTTSGPANSEEGDQVTNTKESRGNSGSGRWKPPDSSSSNGESAGPEAPGPSIGGTGSLQVKVETRSAGLEAAAQPMSGDSVSFEQIASSTRGHFMSGTEPFISFTQPWQRRYEVKMDDVPSSDGEDSHRRSHEADFDSDDDIDAENIPPPSASPPATNDDGYVFESLDLTDFTILEVKISSNVDEGCSQPLTPLTEASESGEGLEDLYPSSSGPRPRYPAALATLPQADSRIPAPSPQSGSLLANTSPTSMLAPRPLHDAQAYVWPVSCTSTARNTEADTTRESAGAFLQQASVLGIESTPSKKAAKRPHCEENHHCIAHEEEKKRRT